MAVDHVGNICPITGLKLSKVVGRYAVYCPNFPGSSNRGYVLRSRYIKSRELGRVLASDEHVHHINGDELDDRAENLILISKGEHARLHYPNGKFDNSQIDKVEVKKLMSQGFGYKRIAKDLKYNVNTIKSVCRRLRKKEMESLNQKV